MVKKLETEYVGDGDRAFRIKGKAFPLIFASNRFSGTGWDIYRVNNAKQYQDFLFNDEFVRVNSPYKPTNVKSLSEAKKKARKMLR